jgi:large-conductance mechanosensitive channel
MHSCLRWSVIADFNITLENASKNALEYQDVMELSGTLQFLICADYINLLVKNVNTLNNSTEVLIDTVSRSGLEEHAEETMYRHACIIMTIMHCKIIK